MGIYLEHNGRGEAQEGERNWTSCRYRPPTPALLSSSMPEASLHHTEFQRDTLGFPPGTRQGKTESPPGPSKETWTRRTEPGFPIRYPFRTTSTQTHTQDTTLLLGRATGKLF